MKSLRENLLSPPIFFARRAREIVATSLALLFFGACTNEPSQPAPIQTSTGQTSSEATVDQALLPEELRAACGGEADYPKPSPNCVRALESYCGARLANCVQTPPISFGKTQFRCGVSKFVTFSATGCEVLQSGTRCVPGWDSRAHWGTCGSGCQAMMLLFWPEGNDYLREISSNPCIGDVSILHPPLPYPGGDSKVTGCHANNHPANPAAEVCSCLPQYCEQVEKI